MDLRSLSISRCRVRASFFDSFSKLPSSIACFQILEALDGQLQRLEVGHHAAQPAVIDVGHAATLGFLGDDLARLALGADEQDGALLGRHLADEGHRLLYLVRVFSRLMMWILLRWPKMYGAILGFQKRVWWPK
jgi:hypothetical protein